MKPRIAHGFSFISYRICHRQDCFLAFDWWIAKFSTSQSVNNCAEGREDLALTFQCWLMTGLQAWFALAS